MIWKAIAGGKVFILLLCGYIFAPAVVSANSSEDERWNTLRSSYFGDRAIVTGDDVISMEAPKRAHDAATVPIVIKAINPELAVKQVHLIVDMNPLPLAGIFKFDDAAKGWHSLETRIRINEYTNIRAVAELDTGELHMTERFVKAAGGCSAPAMADLQVALSNAGKMKLLLDDFLEENAPPRSEAVIKISHPNNSGMQFDQVSRNYIPPFYLHTIVAELNGEPLLNVETNFSLSENPVIRLGFSAEEDRSELLVYALDSKGNRYENSVQVAKKATTN